MLQNKAIRIINFKPFRENVNKLYAQSDILKHEDQVQVSHCLMAFNFLKKRLPISFDDFLVPVYENHNHNTKSAKLKFKTNSKNTTTFGTKSVRNQVISTWNKTIEKIDFDPDKTTKHGLTEALNKYFMVAYKRNDT